MARGDGVDADAAEGQRSTLKRHLVREFGQAKGKRIYEQAERMKVSWNGIGTHLLII